MRLINLHSEVVSNFPYYAHEKYGIEESRALSVKQRSDFNFICLHSSLLLPFCR